jgi:alpha-amylase/alpha-mannosidase (GH57 family)
LHHPLYVAFVWHMHQPYYKHYASGEYVLPWARLHGAKEYVHMAKVLAEYPGVKATFNFVPSLVEQLHEYAAQRAVDRALVLSRQDHWSDEDKAYLLSFFFSANWERVIRLYPRYRQLLDLRQQVHGGHGLLSDDYYRDLVAWFNLVWMDPTALRDDADLRTLVEKDRGFTRAEVDLILRKQRNLVAQVVPLYCRLQESGQIEVTTSPYYHPILPLLVDLDTARRATACLPLPGCSFRYPEDAMEQLRLAVDAHRASFGRAPRGLWPSEGAVCPELLRILPRHGIRWLATDEAVLARSLGVKIERDPYGNLTNPRVLYQPYAALPGDEQGADGQSLAVIFRDHLLSDRIGFVYHGMPGKDAAADLIGRLHAIRERLDDSEHPYLASIILDGENCWESYPEQGDPFLHHLYQGLSEAEDLQTVTVSGYLEQHAPRETIHEMATGSWIGGNLETWIGEADQNRAWEVLAQVRQELVGWQNAIPGASLDVLEAAWRQIYIAEGSDWFWWYYSHNVSIEEPLFDRMFREHLSGVYFIIGRPVPRWLLEPVRSSAEPRDYRATSAYISPHLDAGAEASLEWSGAGFLDATTSTGAMQRAGSSLLRRLYFGYNPSFLYLRVESWVALGPYHVSYFLRAQPAPGEDSSSPSPEVGSDLTQTPFDANWRVDLQPGFGAALRTVSQRGRWLEVDARAESAATERVWEVRLPTPPLGARIGCQIGVMAALSRDDQIVESLPLQSLHYFTLVEVA